MTKKTKNTENCKCYNENFDPNDPCLNCANGEHDEHCTNDHIRDATKKVKTVETEGWEKDLEFILTEWEGNSPHPLVGGMRVSSRMDRLVPFVRNLLARERESVRRETLELIDPFDLVKECNPDCTPEEHAYHQGTWDSFLKLEKRLEELKKLNDQGTEEEKDD